MSQLALFGGNRAVTRPFPRWPEWSEKDTQAVARAVATGKWWMYDYGTAELAAGDETKQLSCVERFERAFAKAHRAKHALAVNSGTSALDVCIRALNLQPGDEVITTPYTFFATSSCVLNAGAWPVYVDIDPATYNIDPWQIASAISERTRAILPVHFAGDLCDMDAISSIACKHGLAVIEDAAQSPGVCLSDDRYAGTFGLAGTFSFQASMCLSCGEGGLILTGDDRFADLCWSLRHCGRSRDGLWYEHVRLGWNLRMPELPAALLLTQFELLDDQNRRRMANVRYFCERLAGVPGLSLTKAHPQARIRNHYLVILRYDADQWDGVSRDRFVQALHAEGVPALAGYTLLSFENPVFDQLPLKPSIDYRAFADRCPHAMRASREEAVWLMHSLFLGDRTQVDAIVGAIEKVRNNVKDLR